MAIFTDNRLADLRGEAGLTQKALATLSKVPWRTIQDQEAGIFRTPNLATARKLTRVLSKRLKRKITVDYVWPDDYNE
jgi:DNA-binding XRE family transcriptional regulator